MSYGFNMCFWQASNFAEATKKAAEVVEALSTPARMKKRIENDLFFVPSIRFFTPNKDWRLAIRADGYWLYSLFNHHFVYWEAQHLLGMAGYLPEDWDAQDKKDVYFGNSCDRNFEFSEWPTSIEFFAQKVQKYQALAALAPMQCLNELQTQGCLDASDMAEITAENAAYKAEYRVLTALYDDIFDTLDLYLWLYGHESDKFKRFSLNSIQSIEQYYDFSRFLRKLVQREREWVINEESMYVPVVLTTPENPSGCTFMLRYDYDSSKAGPITCDDVKARLQRLVVNYLETEDGRRLLKSHGSLNWMQAFSAISSQVFRKNGLNILEHENYCDSVVLDAEVPIDIEALRTEAYSGEVKPVKTTHDCGYKILPLVLGKTGMTLLFRYHEQVVGENVMQRLEDAVKAYLNTKEGSQYLHNGMFDWNEVAKVIPQYVFEEAGFECLNYNEYTNAIVIPEDKAKVEVCLK